MKIIDINGVERTIKDKPEIVTHVRTSVVTANKFENIDGELVTIGEEYKTEVEEKFIQVEIIGKMREWTEWYPLIAFEKMNPDIRL